jgi:F-type H+-transporting ATPase subunit gamma
MRASSTDFRRRIAGAEDLQAVVHTMKALAASSIGQYENSVHSLNDYYRVVELGLSLCLRAVERNGQVAQRKRKPAVIGAVIFGSDQGLVGQFNDLVVELALATLRKLPGELRVWTVGERVNARLEEAGIVSTRLFAVPGSVQAITPLIGEIQLHSEPVFGAADADVYVFYNQPLGGAAYEPSMQQLLPLDESWRRDLTALRWPTTLLPELLGDQSGTLLALIREYLFISLYRACAESLASENAARLAAMQRADKNISEMLEVLRLTFYRERQQAIDEELFDVISGFESLGQGRASPGDS